MHIVSTEVKDIHSAPARTATICLCMMVRNEAAVIERALLSALPWVDAWSIVDTGSTDATPALVAQTMGDLPGKLSYADWVDFATNRSAAFRAAQEQGCDYVLIMDADQTVVVSDPHCLADLTIDGYNIDIHHANLVYPHPWLLKSTLPWRWERTTHEYLACDEPYKAGSLVGLHLVEHADSYRRKTGAKMTEDYALLQAAYDDDPTEPRTVFYLAQACADLGKLPCALRHYRERVKLGGWIEEVWCAQYRAAKILEVQNNWEAAIEAHLTAFSMCSNRAEPLYRLGKGFLAHKQFAPAGLFFAEAADIPLPTGKLFVETGVYEYQALWGLSMVHRLLGNHAEANELENVILKGEHTPARVMADIITSRSSRSIGSLPG